MCASVHVSSHSSELLATKDLKIAKKKGGGEPRAAAAPTRCTTGVQFSARSEEGINDWWTFARVAMGELFFRLDARTCAPG